MTPLDINFRPAFAWQRMGAWVAMSVLALGSCAVAWEAWVVAADAMALSRQSSALGATFKSLDSQRQAALARPPYFDGMVELVHLASFPMGKALDALEGVDVPGTRVIDLRFDNAEHRASAIVEASSAAALESFLEALAVGSSDGRWNLQLISLGGASVDGVVDRLAPRMGLAPVIRNPGGQSFRNGGTMQGQVAATPATLSPELPTTVIRAALVWQATGGYVRP